MTKKRTDRVGFGLKDILAQEAEHVRGDPLLAFAEKRLASRRLSDRVEEASPQLADIPLWCQIHAESGEMTGEGLILEIPDIELPQVEADAWRQLNCLLAKLKENGLQLKFVLTLGEIKESE